MMCISFFFVILPPILGKSVPLAFWGQSSEGGVDEELWVNGGIGLARFCLLDILKQGIK